jgi:hypothetical protein
MSEAQNFAAYRRSVDGLGRLRLFSYLVFPPRGLRHPVFSVEPIAREGNFSAEAWCEHIFPGPYEIGVECAGRIENPVSRVGRVRIIATFEDGEGRQTAEVSREMVPAERAWFDGPTRCGFGLAVYAVPLDIPVNERLHCRVTISDLDGALSHYRPQTIYSRCIVQK